MKVFNVENGVKKVYVQKNDLKYLTTFDINVPQSLLKKADYHPNSVTIKEEPQFIECTDPKEIKFLESIDFIVDFKEYNKLSAERLLDISFKLGRKMRKELDSKHITRRGTLKSLDKHSMMQWIKNDIDKILFFKDGKAEIPFPIVPDSDGFSYSGTEDCPYQMKASLDPNKILFYRKDGKSLTDEEIQNLPKDFISLGVSSAVAYSKNYLKYFGYYNTDVYLTEDKQYLVTEIKDLMYFDDYYHILGYIGASLKLDNITIPKKMVKVHTKNINSERKEN